MEKKPEKRKRRGVSGKTDMITVSPRLISVPVYQQATMAPTAAYASDHHHYPSPRSPEENPHALKVSNLTL